MAIRTRFGSIYLALSENKSVQSLRKTPLLGKIVHGISHFFLPWNTRTWVVVPAGLGRGLKLHLNPRYDSGFWTGDYEEHIQEIFATHLKPGSVVYDVGANIGFFALVAGRLVGPGGSVFAFEADRDNAARLRENVEANSMKQVSVIPSPVWSSNIQVFFATGSDHSSRFVGSVKNPKDGADGFYEQAVTLDGFAKDHIFPDFIKMDIEGGETEALAGASEVFEKASPFLLLEVHNREAEQYVKKWLEERSYTFEWLTSGPAKMPCHMVAWSKLGSSS